MKMAVSDEMICFTYSAESYAKANKAGFISNEILCFNWKGEKIKKYLLPFPISTFVSINTSFMESGISTMNR